MRTFWLAFRVLVVSAAGAVLVYFGANFISPTYRAYESLYFPSSLPATGASALAALRGSSADDGGIVPSFKGALSSPLVGSGPQTATGILTSQESMMAVVQGLKLDKYWNLTKLKSVRRLRDQVLISIDRNGFLRIETNLPTPKMCVRAIKILHEELVKRSSTLTLNVSRKNREFVEKRLADSDSVVKAATDAMVSKLQSSPITDLEGAQKIYLDTKVKLEDAKVRQASATSQITTIESSLSRMLAQANGYADVAAALQSLGFSSKLESMNGALATLATDLQTRRIALEEASDQFTRESPEYKKVERAANAAEKVSKSYIERSKSDLGAGWLPQLSQAKSELESLKTSVTQYESIVQEYENARMKATGDYAAVQDAKANFEAALTARALLQQELEMAKIAEARDPSRFEVVDEPFEDPDPIGPRKGLMAGFAFVILAAIQMIATLGKSKSFSPRDRSETSELSQV